MVAARSLATAATSNHVACQLWNPSTTRALHVEAIALAQTAAVISNISLRRSTARGATPTATVTPTIENDLERQIAPITAFVLETATFGTQPTLAGPDLFRTNLPAAIGSGFMIPLPSQGLFVSPATGLCINTPVAVILQPIDITWFVDD